MHVRGKRPVAVAVALMVAAAAFPASAGAAVPKAPNAAQVKKVCALVTGSSAAAAKARKAASVQTAAVHSAAKGAAKKRAQSQKAGADAALTAATARAKKASSDCKTARARLVDAKDVTRAILIGSFALLLVIAAFLSGLWVGQDNRLSTSKTAATTWTALLAGALLAFVIAKLAKYPQGIDQIVHSGLAGQYGLLIGGPLGAALAAKGITGKQAAEKPASKTVGRRVTAGQLVQNDTGQVDLGDFQYVVFNLVAILFFVGSLIQSPLGGLPTIPDVLLGLTSVSALGYVTKKALPQSQIAKLSTESAPENTEVRITGKGLLDTESPSETQVTVLFASTPAAVGARARPVTTGVDSITVTVPQGLPADQDVSVVLVTPHAGVVQVGSFRRSA